VTSQLPLPLRLDENARLGDYVGDTATKMQTLSGLLFLSGEPGSGKSHLLQGCCHGVLDEGGTAIYLQSLLDLAPSILEGLESYDLVCLDDIDTVVTDDAWQVALFQLINAMKDAGGKLILAARSSVARLEIRLPDLRSRLRGCYLLSSDRLTDVDKLIVIRLKANRRGFEMSEEVCKFILGRAQRDMHHLARLVEQLDVATLRHQKKVTIPFVKEALGL